MIPMVLVVLKAPDQKAAHPEVGTPGASVAFAEAAAPSPSPPLHKAETLPAASGRKGTSIAVDDASYRSTSQPVLPVMMTMTPADLPGPEAAVLMKRTPETSGSGASWGPEGLTRSEENLVKAMILAVTYTCSFTGYATLTGTGPNVSPGRGAARHGRGTDTRISPSLLSAHQSSCWRESTRRRPGGSTSRSSRGSCSPRPCAWSTWSSDSSPSSWRAAGRSSTRGARRRRH